MGKPLKKVEVCGVGELAILIEKGKQHVIWLYEQDWSTDDGHSEFKKIVLEASEENFKKHSIKPFGVSLSCEMLSSNKDVIFLCVENRELVPCLVEFLINEDRDPKAEYAITSVDPELDNYINCKMIKDEVETLKKINNNKKNFKTL